MSKSRRPPISIPELWNLWKSFPRRSAARSAALRFGRIRSKRNWRPLAFGVKNSIRWQDASRGRRAAGEHGRNRLILVKSEKTLWEWYSISIEFFSCVLSIYEVARSPCAGYQRTFLASSRLGSLQDNGKNLQMFFHDLDKAF